MQLNRSKLPPEQSIRVERILRPLYMIPANDAKTLRGDVGFLLNCLDCEDPAARRLAFTELKKVTGEEIDYDPDAPAEKRRAAGREVRAKLAPMARAKPATNPSSTTRPVRPG